MPATPEASARTRAFGPFLVIVPAIIAARAPNWGAIATAFFANEAPVWITGGLLLFSGLLITAHHQVWSSLAAILISLFGWFPALRGLALLAAPQLIARGADPDRADRLRRARADRPLAGLCWRGCEGRWRWVNEWRG